MYGAFSGGGVAILSGAGGGGGGGGGRLEKVYRRKDVRVARSADKWFRLGRVVRPNEIPAKWLAGRARPREPSFRRGGGKRTHDADADADAETAGTPIYRLDQTEVYEPPAVREGRVPRNKFGNVEVYVPSMVPRGGVHVAHEQAARAARTLGIDYAPALTGFRFRGRQGTAVLDGVVVAAEFGEAMGAVLEGLADAQQEADEERRRRAALRAWRRLFVGLTIRERIWSGVDEAERREADRQAELEAQLAEASSGATDEFDMVVDDDGDVGGDGLGGGFLVE